MVKSTSRASYLETKETNEQSQLERIYNVCVSNDQGWSLQEIMAVYRTLNGNIELSSVSARVNKLKEEGRLIELSPRKCTVTNKTINPVTPVTRKKCTHERYKTKDYMMQSNALKRKNGNEKLRIGNIVDTCEDCGVDISHAKRVKVEVIKQVVKKYNIVIRGKKHR